MNKDNVCRSSEFFMAEGDVLNLLFLDESFIPIDFVLVSSGDTENVNVVPDAPTAISASDITSNSFTANWNYSENTLGFYLDVSTSSTFATFVAGYNNLNVGLVNEYSIVGLNDAYVYYYRLRGYNDYGTSGNSNTVITTTAMELIQDFDGNVYTYVTIGTQQWLVENLKTTKFRDGSPITEVVGNAAWAALITEGYCKYNNDPLNIPDYGLLYNWYAVDHHNVVAGAYLAPIGWRVPSNADFVILVATLGGDIIAGGKLKEMGLTHWTTPNLGATDTYGFKALPSGQREGATGFFNSLNNTFKPWTSTDVSVPNADYYESSYLTMAFSLNSYVKKMGFAVRLMRDV